MLLSAICVQKPLLEFQRAKLELEAELVKAAAARENPVSYSIVRPTAFFKSLAGERVLLLFSLFHLVLTFFFRRRNKEVRENSPLLALLSCFRQ